MLFKHYKHHDHLLDTCRRQKSPGLKAFLYFAGLVPLLLGLLVAAYFGAVVLKARRATPAIVKEAMGAGRIRVCAADLPRERLEELIKIEDPAFLSHSGVDLRTPGAGLTTITQALVKIFYFKQFKPGLSKLKQTLIARYAVHPLVSKQDQITLLLNYAYLGRCRGEEMRGFPAAAQCYYGRKLEGLREDEYLSLIAMLIAPDTFNPVFNPRANKDRVDRIKKVISGKYIPKRHMDIYYGPVDPRTQTALAPASYFSSIYEN
jgi:membrane carboxypeptidase/penicillin-binding protein